MLPVKAVVSVLLGASAIVGVNAAPAFAANTAIVTNGCSACTATKVANLTLKDTASGTLITCSNITAAATMPNGVTNGALPFQPTGFALTQFTPITQPGDQCTAPGHPPFTPAVATPSGGFPVFVTATTSGGKSPLYFRGWNLTLSDGVGCTVTFSGSTSSASRISGYLDNSVTGRSWLVLNGGFGGGDDLKVVTISGCGTLAAVGDPITVTGAVSLDNGVGTPPTLGVS